MTKLAITIDPLTMDEARISEYVHDALALAYSEVYLLLHPEQFPRGRAEEKLTRLIGSLRQSGMRLHAVVTETSFNEIGLNRNDLKPIQDMGFKALRLESGFDRHDYVTLMTQNPYGILIEDNPLVLEDAIGRIKAIQSKGNMKQYSASLPYYVHPDTGCTYESCINKTKLFKSCGIEVGIWVNTLAYSSPTFPLGKGCPTLEGQRFSSSNLSASELVAMNLFDTMGFGITTASREEMEDLTRVVSRNTVEVPVYFHPELEPHLKEMLLQTRFKARSDSAASILRAVQFRQKAEIQPFNTVNRDKLALTLDNNLACLYQGEMQIALKNLPSVPYTNVIGQVDLSAAKLVDLLQSGKTSFILTENV